MAAATNFLPSFQAIHRIRYRHFFHRGCELLVLLVAIQPVPLDLLERF